MTSNRAVPFLVEVERMVERGNGVLAVKYVKSPAVGCLHTVTVCIDADIDKKHLLLLAHG